MVFLHIDHLNDKRIKWFVTRHHIEKIDWFTLNSLAYGYFLTCPEKDTPNENDKKLFVHYEVPGIQMTCYRLIIM